MPFKNKEDKAKYMKDWREDNKKQIREYNITIRYPRLKQKRLQIKKEAVNKLGGKCSKCGYDKNYAALEFHHKEGEKKEEEISKLIRDDSRKKLFKELKKCTLLCSNCHKEKHNPRLEKYAPVVQSG